MILFIVCTSFENQLLKDLMNSRFFFFFLHPSDIATKKVAHLSSEDKLPLSPFAKCYLGFICALKSTIPKSLEAYVCCFHAPCFIIIDDLWGVHVSPLMGCWAQRCSSVTQPSQLLHIKSAGPLWLSTLSEVLRFIHSWVHLLTWRSSSKMMVVVVGFWVQTIWESLTRISALWCSGQNKAHDLWSAPLWMTKFISVQTCRFTDQCGVSSVQLWRISMWRNAP